ncbi:MAG: transporter [Rhizobacter sp.]
MKRQLLSASLQHLLIGACIALPAFAQADGDAPITPYRPSVSSPAQLPAEGQLEMEIGGLRNRARDSDARRDSLPYQFKLAFSKEWGVLLGGEAHVTARDTGVRESGVGDTTLVLKHAWSADDTHANGLEFGVKLPTAKDTLGSGKADYTLNVIESIDITTLHIDVNANATRLGVADPGTSRTQLGLSASFSMPLAERWGATAELSGTHRQGADNSMQVLGAVSFSPSKRLTFDLGAARTARPSPGSTSFFAGVVFPITQLW